MRIEQLQYLIELNRSPSINVASQKLFITPSALSIAIKNLEEELGVMVINRTHKGVSLTPAGKRLVTAGEQFFYEVKSIIQDNVPTSTLDISGEVKFYSVHGALENFLPPAICHFCQQHPNITISATQAAANDIFQWFTNAKQEFALVHLIAFQDTYGYEFNPFFRCQLMIQVSPDNPLARYKSVSFKTISDCTVIIHVPPNNTVVKEFFDKIFQRYGYPKKVIYENNYQLCHEMIRSGLGIGFSLLMPFHDQRLIIVDSNVQILLTDTPELHFGYLLNKNIPLSQPSKMFIEYLNRYLIENIDRKFLLTT